MNPVQLFGHELFGDIRIVDQDGEPWFVAKDICDALNIKNPRDAIVSLDEDEKSTVGNTDGALGGPSRNVISESGLYSLILRSRKAEAKTFKKWVTSEVLPSIRKTGKYQIPVALPTTDTLAAVALANGVNIATSAMDLIKIAKAAGPDLLWPSSVVNVRGEAAALVRDATQKREVPSISQVAGVVCSKFFKSKWPELVDFLLYLHENHNGQWIRAAELIHIARESGHLEYVWGDDCTRFASYSRIGRLLGVYRDAEWESQDGDVRYAIEVRKRNRCHEWRLVAKSSIKALKS
ncbi:MAG: Bro-N domain-containing protein [Verrucomicrobiota bacterium]